MDIRSIGSSPTSGQTAPAVAGSTVQKPSSQQENTSPAKAAPTNEEVKNALNDINKALQASSQNLEFSVDKAANEVVVKIVDQQTKQVLRQIPTQEALEISKSLDKLQGLLINQTV